jgi:subtilase family serine protease
VTRFLVLASAVAVTVLGVASASGFAASDRATLHGSAPGWAKQANRVAAADPASPVGFRVYLGWKSGAEAFAKAVSDPKSSSYARYISAAEFRRQFAPTQAQVGAVQSWLRGQGFKVDYTPQNNHYVEAEGTVAQAEAAFGAPFAMYQVNGQTVRAPSGDVSVPSVLADSVSGVIGLDQSWQFVETNHVVDKNAPPSAGFRNAPPLSAFWAELLSPYSYPAGFTDVSDPSTAPWSVKGHTPDQIKGAYGISGFDGAGQTVAIIDAYASPTILKDVNK